MPTAAIAVSVSSRPVAGKVEPVDELSDGDVFVGEGGEDCCSQPVDTVPSLSWLEEHIMSFGGRSELGVDGGTESDEGGVLGTAVEGVVAVVEGGDGAVVDVEVEAVVVDVVLLGVVVVGATVVVTTMQSPSVAPGCEPRNA